MKKLTVLLVAIVLGAMQAFASNNNPIHLEQQLRNEVASLLESPQIVIEKEELSADIEFTFNNNGEIVVLLVDSEKEIVKEYVKTRLNYKKIDSKIIKSRNKVFKLTLKIRKPERV